MALFAQQKTVVGMIHVRALPGTPGYGGDVAAIVRQACEEACLYAEAGVHALALENMHDVPYMRAPCGPEVTAVLARVAAEVKRAVALPCGIQVLAGCNREALAVAVATDLDFIRAEGFVFGHVADEGYIDSCAGDLLRYRRAIGGERVKVLCDIKKKHSAHAITADVSLGETAKAAEFFLADGLIVTGVSTGATASVDDLHEVRGATQLPLLVGSGVTAANLARYFPQADAFIVGSEFKEGGHWARAVSRERVIAFMNAWREALSSLS